jgi:hypothetical protein
MYTYNGQLIFHAAPYHGRRDFIINKETKLNYAFADPDERFPRISARWQCGQQHGGNEKSIFVHWSISCGQSQG